MELLQAISLAAAMVTELTQQLLKKCHQQVDKHDILGMFRYLCVAIATYNSNFYVQFFREAQVSTGPYYGNCIKPHCIYNYYINYEIFTICCGCWHCYEYYHLLLQNEAYYSLSIMYELNVSNYN